MRSVRARHDRKIGAGLPGATYILTAVASAVSEPMGIRSESGAADVPEQSFPKYARQLRAKKAEDLTEGDKLALKRFGAMKLDEISERVIKDRQFFQNFDHVSSPHQVEDSDDTLVIRVYKEGEGSHFQLMHFDREELTAVRNWLMSIDDEHIRQVMPGVSAEELIAQKMIDPNSYVREALTKIANSNDTIRRWLFRSADLHHPLWNPDGTLKDELLPEGWTKIKFKGSGEAPILKEDAYLSDRLQDSYYWRKVSEAHPVDRRCMGAEYDIRRNPNGWIFDMIARKLKATRPVDLDKDYFFELESEKPFESGKDIVWMNEEEISKLNSQFAVKNPVVGKILGDVPNHKNGPTPAMERNRIMDMAFKAKTIKTYVEIAAGETQEESKPNTPLP